MRLTVIALAVAAASCQAAGTTAADKRVSAAQGAELDQACFKGDVDDWDALSRDTLLLREGAEWVQVTLGGSCDADWAYRTISEGVRVRGTSCLMPGDRIENAYLTYSTCSVRAIHQWSEASAGSNRATTVSPASE